MRIGINGRFLIAKQTGVQRAAYNLVATLVKFDRENEYFLFTSFDEVDKPEWSYPNVRVIPSPLRRGETFRNLVWEQVTLPRLARRHKVDLLHSPANMAPLFYRGKSIVHIHDLCFVVNPQWYSFSFRTWYNWVIPRLARRAEKVITNSNNSRNDLMQFCNLPAAKVSLVYWAVDQSFTDETTSLNEDDGEGWPHDDYILYVGSLEPRKNIRTLVEAFEQLRTEHRELSTKLILIGGESPLFAGMTLNIKEYKEDVIFKGFVDEKMLRKYYRNASLVAYPSLYEGFGLPPLEAMASGTAVVTSATSSIPEVVGEAALKVSPHDPRQLAEAMAMVLRDDKIRRSLIERGHQQVKRFSWLRVVRNILAIYHEVHTQSEASFSLWKRLERLEKEPLQV